MISMQLLLGRKLKLYIPMVFGIARAGATGPVGPVLAGPIFVRKRGVTGCVLTLQCIQ